MLCQSAPPFAVIALNQTSYTSAPTHPQPLLANSHSPKGLTVNLRGPLCASTSSYPSLEFFFSIVFYCTADFMPC